MFYLYSEVKHQAVWVSLRQLIEKISPSGVCYHLLQPSRSLKTQENGLVWVPRNFFFLYIYVTWTTKPRRTKKLNTRCSGFVIICICKRNTLFLNLTSPSTVKMESAFWGSKCFIKRLLRWFSTRSWTWAGSTPASRNEEMTDYWGHRSGNCQSKRVISKQASLVVWYTPIWMSHSASRLTVWATAE